MFWSIPFLELFTYMKLTNFLVYTLTQCNMFHYFQNLWGKGHCWISQWWRGSKLNRNKLKCDLWYMEFAYLPFRSKVHDKRRKKFLVWHTIEYPFLKLTSSISIMPCRNHGLALVTIILIFNYFRCWHNFFHFFQ